jgi:riboflavin transporter FmnP
VKVYKLVATALLAGLAIFFQFYNGVLGLQTGFGMTVDLAALPALLALFVLGFDASFEVIVVLALAIALIAETGYIGAIMKFAATLPMLALPALYVVAFKKKLDVARIAALVLLGSLVVVAIFALLSYPALLASQNFGGLPLAGVYFIGLLPVALIALVSLALYKFFAEHAQSEALLKLSSAKHALAVLVLALVIRGISMVITNAFFAGPLFFHLQPHDFIAFLENTSLPLFGKGSAWFGVIFFWNCVQGALEFGLAWLIAFRLAFAKRYGLRGAPTPA